MAPIRTPPGETMAAGETIALFNAQYICWKKMLQRANTMRIKILRAMMQDGSTRAAELLGEKPRYENAERCNQCAGCLIMQNEQACQTCRGCVTKKGCVEYSRLCFAWDRVAKNYFSGSIMSDASSNFDLATADLRKYEALINDLKEAAIAIDLALDDLPSGHAHKSNPRYSQERIGRDVTNEEAQFLRISELLNEHRDLLDRLSEVETDQFLLEGLWGSALDDHATGQTQDPRSFLQFTQATDLDVALLEVESRICNQNQDKVISKPSESGNAKEDIGKTATQPRRRSQSDPLAGTQDSRADQQNLQDRLFNLIATTQTRKDKIATKLIGLETVLTANPVSSSSALDYVDMRVAEVSERVEKLEELQREVWVLTARTNGEAAQTSQSLEWRRWIKQVTTKIGTIQEDCLGRRMKAIDVTPVLHPGNPCCAIPPWIETS